MTMPDETPAPAEAAALTPLKCPNCSHEFRVSLTPKFKDNYRLKYRLVPNEGTLLCADTVGRTLDLLTKMLDATARDLGVGTKTFIESMTFSDVGAIEFGLLVTEYARKPRKRKGTS